MRIEKIQARTFPATGSLPETYVIDLTTGPGEFRREHHTNLGVAALRVLTLEWETGLWAEWIG